MNLGLRLVEAPDIEAHDGDELEVGGEEVINLTTGRRFDVVPPPESRAAIVEAGGLIAYTRNRLMEKVGV